MDTDTKHIVSGEKTTKVTSPCGVFQKMIDHDVVAALDKLAIDIPESQRFTL